MKDLEDSAREAGNPEAPRKLREVHDYTTRCYEKLYAVLAVVSEEQARFRPGEGAWSVGELAHHIVLAQASVLRGVEKLMAKAEAENLGPAVDSGSALSSLDHLAARAGEKFQAPAHLVPDPNQELAASVGELKRQQQHLRNLLPRLAVRDLHRLKFPHPLFGDDFDLYQWILFLGRHASRHRAQMERVIGHTEYPRSA